MTLTLFPSFTDYFRGVLPISLSSSPSLSCFCASEHEIISQAAECSEALSNIRAGACLAAAHVEKQTL